VRLASIHIYPMKAARAVDLDESRVEPWGLAGDRRWLLVDGNGRFISQREEPSLARVVVQPGAGSISVSADGVPGPTLAPPPADAPLLKVTVWDSTLLAAEAGPAADAWFSAYLGGPVPAGLPGRPDPAAGRPAVRAERGRRQLRRRLPAAA
jgi:uncharacterized protein YcbX